MDNRLYLTKSPGTNIVCIGIGTNKRRRVWLSDDDALKLAYRLMSLGSDTIIYAGVKIRFGTFEQADVLRP